jgi:hypothetical protein
VGASTLQVVGVEPDLEYNVRLLHRVNGGTGRSLMQELIVQPSP